MPPFFDRRGEDRAIEAAEDLLGADAVERDEHGVTGRLGVGDGPRDGHDADNCHEDSEAANESTHLSSASLTVAG